MHKNMVRGIGAILLAGTAFGAYSLVTLPRPDVQYGDPSRVTEVAPLPNDLNGNWPYFGRDIGGSQWSPLDQINLENVSSLKVAWQYDGEDFIVKPGFAGTRLQVNPLFIKDTIYSCSSFDRVTAHDPETGKIKWTFDPHALQSNGKPVLPGERVPFHCRGVAYWADPVPAPESHCATRIFRSSSSASVVAMDARTGKSCEMFGAEKNRSGYITHFDYESHGEGVRGASSPPLVVGEVLVAAANAADGLMNAADGIVRGFDVRTGALKWEFNPIPEDKRDITGAANVWTLLSGDDERKLVFLATTSPSTDFFGGMRKFDIPYANAVVAVSTETGEVVWHYQTLRHDLWDYDLPGHPLSVTIVKDGAPRDVIIQQTKMGTLFVLDRDTGEPVFPIQDMAAPASDVPGERAAPTQPMPVLPETFARTHLTRDDLFGLTPIDRAWCRAKFDKLRYDGMFTPPSAQGSLVVPAALGGGNWGGAAYDPKTNLLLVKSENLGTIVSMRPSQKTDGGDTVDFLTRTLAGTGYETTGELFLSPLGIPCTPPPWGTLTAIDMSSGKRVWQIPLGQSKRGLLTAPAFLNWGSPNVGGPLITAGGLVFVGATLDGKFRALDVRTGREVWSTRLPAPGMSVPSTYSYKGRQYVVTAAGGNSLAETEEILDSLVAFTLPEN